MTLSAQSHAATHAYTFRTAQGVWINDMRNRALSHSRWPCVVLDDRAMADLTASFRLQASSGYNCVTLFGLLTANVWEPDIPRTVSSERAAKVRTLLKEAQSAGLKVLYRPRDAGTTAALARVFEEAEDAFFACSRLRTEEGGETRGQIHLTPLFGRRPGPPLYLHSAITDETREEYFRRLRALLPCLDRLEGRCRSRGRIARIRRCIHSVLAERV